MPTCDRLKRRYNGKLESKEESPSKFARDPSLFVAHYNIRFTGTRVRFEAFVLRRIKKAIPWLMRGWLRRKQRELQNSLLPLRRVRDLGELRRLTPVDRNFGWNRGCPIDRYYIEMFLAERAEEIRGSVLEFQSDTYTKRFGGGHVRQSDVLDLSRDNPQASLFADIENATNIDTNSYDCILCTQVLLLVYDLRAAISTLHRILKPGGVVLVTVPGIAHKRVTDLGVSDYWRLTSVSARRIFEETFPKGNVEVKVFGNVLAATAFLYGLAMEELLREEIEYSDPDYEVTIAVRAVK